MKLIDKDRVVAEIERLKTIYKDDENIRHVAKYNILVDILSFLDTLEVKEADLEAEINKWRHNHFHGRRDKNASGEYLERISQLELAKHFFELGIEKSVDESIIRKIVDLNNEAAKHYDAVIKKERNENGFSQLAIDLLDHNVDANELRIQYIIENLKAQKGE